MSRRAIATFAAALMALGSVGLAPSTAGAVASCFDRAATITSNAEFVPGTDNNDVIITGDAENGVVAHPGDDRVCTGAGADFVRGDLGDDLINTGPGNDKVSGGDLNFDNPSGNDTILGGGGGDELNGHDGADTLRGGPGSDILRGGPGRTFSWAVWAMTPVTPAQGGTKCEVARGFCDIQIVPLIAGEPA